MWNLDDPTNYFKLLRADVPFAYAWGGNDRFRRERIREKAAEGFPKDVPPALWWAFRIYTRKAGSFDVDNIPKLVVDAFCRRQITLDESAYDQVALFDDDIVSCVG